MKEKIKIPKSMMIFLITTLIFTLISLLGNIYFINIANNTGILYVNNISVCFLSLIGCVGLVITETLGIKEYKNTFNKKRKINNEFKNKIESTKTETYNYSLNNNVDYSKVTKSFINYFDEKYYPCSYSIDLLYKIIFGMQQSGYTNKVK